MRTNRNIERITENVKRGTGITVLSLLFCVLRFAMPLKAWAGVIVGNPAIVAEHVTSIDVSWGSTATASGYEVDASTASDFSGVLDIATTNNPAASTSTVGVSVPLAPNTTYFVQIGGVSGGTTNYINTVPTWASTLASPLMNVQLIQVTASTITVSWTAFGSGSGTNTSEGYMLQLSSTNFTGGMIYSSTTSTLATSTLTVAGLQPGTTYFLQAGALNWNLTPNFASFLSTVTAISGGGLPAPTGLHNIAITFNSINWTWNLVGPATSYNIYEATSPTTLIGNTTTPPWIESGLLTNTAHGIVVSALGPGQISPLSVPTTFYTQANLPGTPTITGIGSSSFTLTWGAGGNPGYTPYRIDVAPDSTFTTGVFTPIPFSANLTANTTNVIGLAANTPYFVRVTAQNGDGIPSAPSTSAFATTKQNGTITGAGSGLGSASLLPSVVPEGGVVTATVTFTVPSVGMGAGGRLEIDVPPGWWPNILQNNSPFQDGYVTATSTAGVSFNLSFSNSAPVVTVSFTSGFLSAGTQIQVTVNNIHPNCPAPNQNQLAWEIKSAMSTADAQSDIAPQPTQTFTKGPAQWVGYNPWNPLTVVTGQASQGITIQSQDTCGVPVPVVSAATVTLQGLLTSQSPDSGAQFSNASNFATTTTSVVLSAGSSTATYFYETSTLGSGLWIVGTYQFPGSPNSQQVWRSVNVLAAAPSLGNLSVDTGSPVAGQSSVTISPDGTGVNNLAYIRFLPSDSTLQWHVAISSTNFATTVYDQWGYGDPQGTVSWLGQNIYQNYATVPNGTYTVKVEFLGVVSNTTLTIVVNTAQISGSVTLGGSAVSGVQINAQGSNGPGYSSAVSDAGGNYVLYGLHSGTQYNLYATYTSTTSQAVVTGQINNVSAGASGQNFTLTTPNVIRVSAVAPGPAAATIFGNLNVHSSDYTQNFFGNLRLVAGSSTTDNGNSFNPSTWTVFYVQHGTYTLHLTMPGYGATDVTVTNSADVVMPLTHEASVYGILTLPVPAPYPFWASVNGTPTGSNTPTVWGGASFNVGQSTAVYSIFAVTPGNYTFLSQVSGYVPSVLSNVTVGSNDLGNPATGGEDFPTFGVGGTISGTLTINGDTSGMASPITIYLNAYSPQLGYNVSTQVQLSTSATQTSAAYQIGGVPDGTYQMFPPYLQGFDSSVSGPQSVVVSGGTGSKNMVLTQETGKITATFKLPNGQSDYTNVHITVQGPINIDQDLTSGPVQTLSHLGTGFFSVSAYYRTTGAQVQTTVNLTNGQNAALVLDLSAPTFTVSGTVSVQSGFSMRSGTATATVNTITDLLANATNQNIYIGGTTVAGGSGVAGGSALDCSQTVPVTTSTARVEAFPKFFNSFGNSNRSGFTNCFAVGQYNYGTIQADGTYSIPNLSPGLWEIDVYPYFDNSQTPDAASQQQFITVTSGNVGSVNFALSGGNSVSGTVSLPAGVTDNRQFNVQIIDTNGNSIQSTFLQLGTPAIPASSVPYQFNNLAAGQYSLLIQDPGSYDSTLNTNVIKYVAAPVQFKINGADVTNLNVTMGNAARIIGTIGIQTTSATGSPTLTLITANNTNLLPSNFMINAQADPWIPGGSQSAEFSPGGSGPDIDSNNHFTIDGLSPGTYDVVFQQNSYGIAVQAAGGLNLASFTQGSVVVAAGQTVDLGVITLKPGISVSGNVVDTSGNPLSNITVQATPSNSQHGQNSIQTTTDAQGNFTLTGLSPDLKIYDVVAAPRSDGGEPPPVPYGQVSRLAVDVTQVPAPTLNFILTPASAQITGRILTADGESLSYPDGDQVGYPAAAIFLHLEGSTSDNNPLGQEYATALDGSFSIGDLVPGLYDVIVESLGYQPYKVTGVALTNGTTQNLAAITLQRGAELDATLARPDGSLVNTGQVQTVVAVSPDLTSIIFGQVNKDATTGNILSLKFSGFQVTPQTYNVLLFDNQNNITTPPEGRGLVFVSSSEVITRALTYEPSPPFAYVNAKRAGSIGTAVNLTYYFSRPLRNQGNDQDPSQWFSLTGAQGVLSGYQLSGDRTQLTVIYTPAAGEQNATIAFSAHTVDIDPSTGIEFVLSKTITLLLGQKATSESNINSALGGSLSLSNNNDPSNVSIPGNSLLGSDGSAADATVSYNFTLTATDDINSIASASAAPVAAQSSVRSAAIGHLMALRVQRVRLRSLSGHERGSDES